MNRTKKDVSEKKHILGTSLSKSYACVFDPVLNLHADKT